MKYSWTYFFSFFLLDYSIQFFLSFSLSLPRLLCIYQAIWFNAKNKSKPPYLFPVFIYLFELLYNNRIFSLVAYDNKKAQVN